MVFDACGRYHQLTVADEKMHIRIKESFLSGDGKRKYGMKLAASIDDITDESIDKVSSAVSTFVERLNSGETVDLKRELSSTLYAST